LPESQDEPVQVWSALDLLVTVTLVPQAMETVCGENCQLTPELTIVSAEVFPDVAHAVGPVCVGFGAGLALDRFGVGLGAEVLGVATGVVVRAVVGDDDACVRAAGRADVARAEGETTLVALCEGVTRGAVVDAPLTAGDPPPHAASASEPARARTIPPRLRMCQDTYADIPWFMSQVLCVCAEKRHEADLSAGTPRPTSWVLSWRRACFSGDVRRGG